MSKRFSKEDFILYAKRALYIVCSWVLISVTIFYFEFLTLTSYNALDSSYDFQTSILTNVLVSFIAGLVGGLFLVHRMQFWLRTYAFWMALCAITLLYLLFYFVIALIGAAYYFTDYTGASILAKETQTILYEFLWSWVFFKNLIIWFFIVLSTLVVLMINDKYGPGVFSDYLLGRYFLPKKESRIFMFVDIKNATTIAENIGEQAYFNFLKDFFNDITPAILQTQGEIYQYVGDEVVLTWKMKKGLHKSNALRCFFKMQDLLSRKRTSYQNTYNHFPTFKVGIHCGSVTVGELGKIKRDIAFSGDVLNTTSRIQAMCNEKGVKILASTQFANLLYNLPKTISKKELGEQLLKGKINTIQLVTFERQAIN